MSINWAFEYVCQFLSLNWLSVWLLFTRWHSYTFSLLIDWLSSWDSSHLSCVWTCRRDDIWRIRADVWMCVKIPCQFQPDTPNTQLTVNNPQKHWNFTSFSISFSPDSLILIIYFNLNRKTLHSHLKSSLTILICNKLLQAVYAICWSSEFVQNMIWWCRKWFLIEQIFVCS